MGASPGRWGWYQCVGVDFWLASEKVMGFALVDLGMVYKVKHKQQ